MKKIKYIIICLLFTIFIPKAYAFTYEIGMTVDDTFVKVGTNKEIKVSLKNIQGTNGGINVCSLNITSSESIVRNDIKTLNSWSLTEGNIYLFETGNPVLSNTEFFIIPVRVNAKGYVEISNIVCSDGTEEVEINGQKINFSIKEENASTDNSNVVQDNDKNDDNKLSSNCNISSIELSNSSIEFDSNITEYIVKTSDFNSLEVIVELENSKASYFVDKNFDDYEKSIVITVSAEDGSSKVYTLYIDEENDEVVDKNLKEEKNSFDYTIIFIIIIFILLLINIYRIIRNIKK